MKTPWLILLCLSVLGPITVSAQGAYLEPGTNGAGAELRGTWTPTGFDGVGLLSGFSIAGVLDVGVDLFVDWTDGPQKLGDKLIGVAVAPFKLSMVTNRGVKVYPDGAPETFCVDHYRCRFFLQEGLKGSAALTAELMMRVAQSGFDVVKTEGLFTFDGEPGYSLGQGQ